MRINKLQHTLLYGLGALALAVSVSVSASNLAEEQRALVRAHQARDQALQRSDLLDQQAAAARDDESRARARTAAIAARLQAAEADMEAAQTRIDVIETLRRRQRARLAEKQEPAVKLIAALQLMSKRPTALAFVQPGSIRDMVHLQAVFASMLPIIRLHTADLRAEVARGTHLKEQADVALAALKSSRTQLLSQQNALALDAATARQRAAQFAANAQVEQDRAVAMGEQAHDIKALMTTLAIDAETRDELAELPGPTLRPLHIGSSATSLPLPLPAPNPPALRYRLPAIGEVITGLGEETTPGVRSRGLTISTQPNALVIAPSEGRIAYVGAFRGFGQIVIIDHGRGLTTLITSLSQISVRVGDTVIQGSPIGRAGNDRPTITVELRRKGVPIDITPLIS